MGCQASSHSSTDLLGQALGGQWTIGVGLRLIRLIEAITVSYLGGTSCCVVPPSVWMSLWPCSVPTKRPQWSCQFWGQVDRSSWRVMFPQGPGYISQSQQWQALLYDVATQQSWHLHCGEVGQCISPLNGSSFHWGDCEFQMSYGSGGHPTPLISPSALHSSLKLLQFWLWGGMDLAGFWGLGRGHPHPIGGFHFPKYFGIGECGKWSPSTFFISPWMHSTSWHSSPGSSWGFG